MAKTIKSYQSRETNLQFEEQRTGWYLENCFNPQARKWAHRLVNTANRRHAKKMIEKELEFNQ